MAENFRADLPSLPREKISKNTLLFVKKLAFVKIMNHSNSMDSSEITRRRTINYDHPQGNLVGSEPAQGPRTEHIRQAPYGGQPATGSEGQTPSIPNDGAYQARPTSGLYRSMGRGLTHSVQDNFNESLRKTQPELDPRGTAPDVSGSENRQSGANSQNI